MHIAHIEYELKWVIYLSITINAIHKHYNIKNDINNIYREII